MSASVWSDKDVHEWLSDFALISHIPNDSNLIRLCHEAGIKVIIYVNFMEMLDTKAQLSDPKGKPYYDGWAKNPGCELVDLKDHPNWICIDNDGKRQQSLWGLQTICPDYSARVFISSICMEQP